MCFSLTAFSKSSGENMIKKYIWMSIRHNLLDSERA